MLEKQLYRTTWLGLKSRPFDHYPNSTNYFASVGTCVAHDKKHKGNSYLYNLSKKLNLDFLDVAIHSNNLEWQDIQLKKIMTTDIVQPKFFIVQLQHPYYWHNSIFYKFLGDENIGHKHPLPTKDAYLQGCNFLKKKWLVHTHINQFTFLTIFVTLLLNLKCYKKLLGTFLMYFWIDGYQNQIKTILMAKHKQ